MTAATQEFTGTFTADPIHSSFLFAVQHMKVSTFRAGFGDVEARLEGGDSGISLEGRARVASVSITDPPEFREHVVNGEEFFDGRNHPEIVFRSTRVELAEDGGVEVDGELEIKGVTRAVTATGSYQSPVGDPFGASRAAIELRAVLDRREWDMNWQMPLPAGGDALGYEVELTVQLELVKRAEPMLVLGISGSLRAGSYNTRLLLAAARGLPPEAEFRELTGFDRIPPYNQDLDRGLGPAPVCELREALRRADAILISTPEYNHSIPGQLKNALDWASRPFPDNSLRGRPVAVVGASTSLFGAVWAQAEVRKVLAAAGARVLDAELPVASAADAFDADGALREPGLRARLAEIAGELVGVAAVPELRAA